MTSDLTVQNDHMLGVRVQPVLHGFAHGTDLIQRRGVHVWPTEVVNLREREGEDFSLGWCCWVFKSSTAKQLAIESHKIIKTEPYLWV